MGLGSDYLRAALARSVVRPTLSRGRVPGTLTRICTALGQDGHSMPMPQSLAASARDRRRPPGGRRPRPAPRPDGWHPANAAGERRLLGLEQGRHRSVQTRQCRTSPCAPRTARVPRRRDEVPARPPARPARTPSVGDPPRSTLEGAPVRRPTRPRSRRASTEHCCRRNRPSTRVVSVEQVEGRDSLRQLEVWCRIAKRRRCEDES